MSLSAFSLSPARRRCVSIALLASDSLNIQNASRFISTYLRFRTSDKQIPEKEALLIVRSIAGALCYAWNEFHILHRDIKPANIMLDSKKIAKLMDMGISKSMSEEKGLTMTGMIVGTPYYMSPEQARADADIDCHSDIYALGATLYHLVTGKVPYDATTAIGILTKHITDPFPPPQEKNPNVSSECSVLLEIMMSKKAENRQKNWEDVIRDIDLVMNGKFPQTKRPGAGDSVIMQMAQSQALNRRKGLKSPPLAKVYSAESSRAANSAPERQRHLIKISAVAAGILIAAIIVVAVLVGKAKESKHLADAEKIPADYLQNLQKELNLKIEPDKSNANKQPDTKSANEYLVIDLSNRKLTYSASVCQWGF